MLADERTLELTDLAAFVEATRRELLKLDTLEETYAFWTANLGAFTDAAQLDQSGSGAALVSALKEPIAGDRSGDARGTRPRTRRDF